MEDSKTNPSLVVSTMIKWTMLTLLQALIFIICGVHSRYVHNVLAMVNCYLCITLNTMEVTKKYSFSLCHFIVLVFLP